MNIAVFGGTFDPIHCAHLAVAREAAEGFRLDRVLFVVAANPPHKAGIHIESYADRYRMVQLACEGQANFEASDLEANTEKSYSITTIERLRANLKPGDRLFFLIGADAFADIRTWYRWRDIIEDVEFIVVARPGHAFSVPEGANVHRLTSLALEVSSSAIRNELAAGGSPAELPAPVLAYIKEHNLYRRCHAKSSI